MFELTPSLDQRNDLPLYQQLYNFIRQEIVTGKIRPGEKLPSKRKLAHYLGLSVNTIQAAYDQLSAEGYVESIERKGLYVALLDGEPFAAGITASFLESQAEEKEPPVYFDFNSGKVDLGHFPYSIWKKLTIQSLNAGQGEIFNTGHPQGELRLREEISRHLFASRGVRCTANQIVIGAGAQYLIGLLPLIIGREHPYAFEDPGFHRTRKVLTDQGVSIKPIPLDKDGLSAAALKASQAKIVYVTPSHQFPIGMVMPVSRRQELLKWAVEENAYIIEDDYDGEYRYKGKPIPSMQGLDSKGRVIYLGTFSKSMIPSIRISFLVLPPLLLEKYQNEFQIYKQTVSRLHQVTLFHFMKEGHFQNHLNRMRTLYRKKHSALLFALRNHFGDRVRIIGEKSGLHIMLEVKNGMTEEMLIASAKAAGVRVYPYSIYLAGNEEGFTPKILLGFGGLSEDEIEEGIRLLRNAWLPEVGS